jgi:hypothetical protein
MTPTDNDVPKGLESYSFDGESMPIESYPCLREGGSLII